MELVLGLLAGVLRTIAFYTVFYAIGNGVLKIITLGRYPRARHLRENWRQGLPEFDLVALFGLMVVVGIVILVATLMHGAP